MSLAVNDLFLVSAFGSCFGQRTILTNWYSVQNVDGTVSEDEASADILDQLRAGGGGDQYETKLRDCMPPEWTLDFWQVQKVAPVRYVHYRTSRGVAGLHAGSTETVNQSIALQFGTPLAGRDQISVKKLGPIPQHATVQADGMLVAAYKTLAGTLATAMALPMAFVGARVFSVYASIAHKTPPGSYSIITTSTVQETLRVNRRRTVGVGI